MGVKNRERRRAKKQRDRAEANRRSHQARQPGRASAAGAAGPPDDRMARAAVLAAAEAFRSEPDAVYRAALAGLVALDASAGPVLVDRAVAWAVDLALDRAWDSGWQPADVPRILVRELGKAHAATLAPAVAASATRRPECAGDERWAAQAAAISVADPGLDPEPGARAVEVEALSLLLHLPVLPRLSSPSPGPTGRSGGSSVAVLDRVRALLAKAESSTFPEEAEAFTAKAQELMARHAIDEALLEAGGDAGPTPVVGWRIGVDDPYAEAKSHLLGTIAQANRCRSVWSKDLGFSTVFGVRTDLRVVELLFTSLLVQGTRAMLHAGRSVDRSGRSRTRSFRQSFLLAFASRVGERLAAATTSAVADAAAHHAALLPVLAGRAEAVDHAIGDAFPELTRHTMAARNHAGWFAGRAAGDLASLSVGERLSAAARP